MTGSPIAAVLRELAPGVLATLVRRYGDFAACEDATQEAMLAATTQWPREGMPDNPRGWLVTVAQRRLIDEIRSESARRRREEQDAAATPESEETPARDDSLALLFLCCHPALTPPSQIALTLRAVGGLSTAQLAAAFLVPEATMAQRITRAKQTVDSAGRAFVMPPPAERAARLSAVLHVLYLIFNEGYTATAGTDLTAPDLSDEGIRLARMLFDLLPEDTEVAGLLALMLLTDARRAARVDSAGDLVPLDEQDRGRWDHARVTEGVELITATLARGDVGPYQLQAAIAAVHDEAATVETTDWPQILALYDLLGRIAPNPMTALNRAVAVAMVRGPAAGLAVLAELESDKRLARHHRLLATRAHLRELEGDRAGAARDYRAAAARADSAPEQRYLAKKISALTM
ncbi:DUF6596 domain-containing protein [Nocardia sp. NPDC005978]|uniref:RNA polymerase sigma factor n=1 Tax=Nocardia sp. NPDC005978 TaxID=3156725 RepID=UPI0033AC28A9